jgi:hypothetical protein
MPLLSAATPGWKLSFNLQSRDLDRGTQDPCNASRGSAPGFARTPAAREAPVCGSNFAVDGNAWQPREQYRGGAGGSRPIHAYTGNGGRTFAIIDVARFRAACGSRADSCRCRRSPPPTIGQAQATVCCASVKGRPIE